MLAIILLWAITIVLIVLGAIAVHKNPRGIAQVGFFAIAIIIGIVALVASASLININRRFDAFEYRYENTKALLESYPRQEYGNMTFLTTEIIEINNEISEHKAYAHSKLCGVWYSKKIGNLEPLTFSTINKQLQDGSQ